MSSTPDHYYSLLLNQIQLDAIEAFIETISSPAARKSAHEYLKRLDRASNSKKGIAYINLYNNGKLKVTDYHNAEYEKLNQKFLSSTSEKKQLSLFDHFKMKAEMEKEMGRTWSIDDTEVRSDFGRVFVSKLQWFHMIEKYYY